MNKAYHEILPRDYFENLFEKVKNYVSRGECVLISAMYGLGNKTAFNFLNYLFGKRKIFDKVLTYDPHVQKVNLLAFCKKIDTKYKNLIIIRFFETFENKNSLLENIDSIRRKNPQNLAFIVLTDYTGITNPLDYVAKTKPFFTQRIYLGPFSFIDTQRMILTFNRFYNWKINKKDIKKIFELSGGIPRLIKYICKEIVETKTGLNRLDDFYNISIIFELNYLSKIIIQLPSQHLSKLGIINKNGEIVSKLLRVYFKNYVSTLIQELYPNLTLGESKILTYLIDNDKNILTPDKIANLLKMTDDNFSLWAIYKTISRLKPKIKNNYTIINLKGKGYVLSKVSASIN